MTLSTTPKLPNFAYIGTDHNPSRGDDHQVVVLLVNHTSSGNMTGFLSNPGGNDASTTTIMGRILVNGSALAVAMLGHDQQFTARSCKVERNDHITWSQANAAYAATCARGRAQLCYREADSLSFRGDHQYIIVGVG